MCRQAEKHGTFRKLMADKAKERTDPYVRFDDGELRARIESLNYDPSLRLLFDRYKWYDPMRESFKASGCQQCQLHSGHGHM